MLRLKAKELSDDPSFKASHGWYQKWKWRHSLGMQSKTTLPQPLPADLEENIVRFRRFVIAAWWRADYPLSHIYNMDKTPMRFELPSSRTVPVKSGASPLPLPLLPMERNCPQTASSNASGHQETWLYCILFVFPSIRGAGWMSRVSESGSDRVCYVVSTPFWCGTHFKPI